MASDGPNIMADETFETPEEAAAGESAATPADAAELTRQRDDYYDRLLRATAEFDNYRRRTERERQQFAESAAADLIKELLPLIDDLERAARAEGGTDGGEGVRRGVELIHRQLLDTLRKRGVTPIDAVGQDFDPHFHNAVTYEPAEGRRDGEVLEEFARGYMLGDRLLRPAMVKVARG